MTSPSRALSTRPPRAAATASQPDAARRHVGGGWVAVEDSDDVCDLDEATCQRIVDLFVSTRLEGCGAGTTAMMDLVRGPDGELELESTPGRGPTARVPLPGVAAVLQPRAEPASHASPPDEGLVLAVDDEPSVLGVATRILRAHGYRVLAAADGLEALELFRAHAGEIAVVLLDRSMPRLDGLGTLERLRELDRELPVVLTSGFDERELLARLAADPRVLYLAKPYSVESLAAAIAAALGLRPDRG